MKIVRSTFECTKAIASALILTFPLHTLAGFEEVQVDDPLAKSVAEIEMPVSGDGLGKCTGVFIREDVLLTETHCVSGEDRVHRIVVGPGPGYEGRRVYLSRKILLLKRFTKPSPALIFLAPVDGETLSARREIVQPLAILFDSSMSWTTSLPMKVLGYGKREGVSRLRSNERTGSRGNWWKSELIVSPRTPDAFLVHGDSGGPALVHTTEGWKIWGTTWAIEVGYDLFMHVGHYGNWIGSSLAREPRLPSK